MVHREGIEPSNAYIKSVVPYHLATDAYGTPGGTQTPDTVLRRHVLCSAELLAHMVGRVGVEPTIPEGAGFTVRCVCRFATYPY